MAALRRSREVREPLARDAAALPDDRLELADTIAAIGALLEKTGDLAGALAEQRRAQELFRALAVEHPAVPLYRRDLAVSHVLGRRPAGEDRRPGRGPGRAAEGPGAVPGPGRRAPRRHPSTAASWPSATPGSASCSRRPATWPGPWPSSGGSRS